MKIFCLIFLTVLGASLATPTRARSRNQAMYDKLDTDSFENQVQEFLDTCSLTEDDLARALERVLEKAQEINMDHTNVCDCIEEHFMDIMEPLTDLIDTSCNRQANIGNFAKALALSLQSVSEYICGTDGKHLMELMHPCLRTEDKYGESDEECVERVMETYENRMEDYMTNSNIVNFMCESVQDAYERCIQSKLSSRCNMKMTRDALNDLVEAFMAPCNEEARLLKKK